MHIVQRTPCTGDIQFGKTARKRDRKLHSWNQKNTFAGVSVDGGLQGPDLKMEAVYCSVTLATIYNPTGVTAQKTDIHIVTTVKT
jgi:hypothetical protein